LAALHHESDAFELANISNGVARNRNQICKFPGLNRADAVAPAQHFGRIASDSTNHIKSRHSGLMQLN